MVVFDFMGIVRELPIKTTIPKIQTFGELSAVIFRHIKTLSRKAKRVDIPYRMIKSRWLVGMVDLCTVEILHSS